MQVRAGGPSDVDAAVVVWRAAREARVAGITTSPERERRTRAYLARPDGFLVVADGGGEVVGMGLAMDALADDGAGAVVTGLCHIGLVYVAPTRWGERIGAALVDALLDEARARGYRSVQLWTEIDNERAQRLYESRAFKRSGREKDRDVDDRIVHYERSL